jgi:magnesium transporter
MIDLLVRNNDNYMLQKVHKTNEIAIENLDFIIAHFQDYTQNDIEWVKSNFNIDFSIMTLYEDIEISSHFAANENQAAFNFSIPYYNTKKEFVEEQMFIILTKNRVFFFSSSKLDEFFTKTYTKRLLNSPLFGDVSNILKFTIEFLSDYFADITESLAKKIKILAGKVLIEKKFTDKDLDVITLYNFNNLLIKESINEAVRIFKLYRKSNYENIISMKEVIETELNDLAAVSDYIQFNFDRLDDLKENISNKIELEQNYIFKILTMVTICVSLPTLIAGIYGMNFQIMPELKWAYGYPTALTLMTLSIFIPIILFKRKQWL